MDVDNDDDSSIPASRIGAKYVLFITDNATRYRWCFFLSHRSAAIVSFRHWLQSVKNQGFSAPAFVVSDNEFYSKDWAALYHSEGITWQPSAPHSPWQTYRSLFLIYTPVTPSPSDAIEDAKGDTAICSGAGFVATGDMCRKMGGLWSQKYEHRIPDHVRGEAGLPG